MTSQNFGDPDAIKHFQSICDACQELISRYHSPSELKLYVDGYMHALRKTKVLQEKDLQKLDILINKWIMDPSSFVGPNGDLNNLFFLKNS